MAINGKFAIKHIRPITTKGYESFCNDDQIDLLQYLGLDLETIAEIFETWKVTAEADPMRASEYFSRAASDVAEGRWDWLDFSPASTVMFLDDVQLADLSSPQLAPNSSFTWTSPTPLAVCVTIDQQTRAKHVLRGKHGFYGNTDQHGTINHFGGLF